MVFLREEENDSAALTVSEQQLKHISQMKEAGYTGTFDLTFSIRNGTEVTVKVILT